MKILQSILILIFAFSVTSIQAQNLKRQKRYLPKVIKKMKVYLGSTEAKLLDRCPTCEQEKTTAPFRRIYIAKLDDDQFESVVFYVSTSKSEVYEMILIAKKQIDVSKAASKLLGSPNAKDGEWRFYPDKTKQKFTIACWIYKNKLVIAGSLPGSEWEPGFN